jgi:cyclic-di-AMP phosphodiesterase PgpH
MDNYLDRLTHRIPNYAKYIALLVVLFALAFLFPSNAKFKYRFSEGQMWLYDDLYANFDFPIKKSEAELGEERATVEREFSPYFELNEEFLLERKKLFAKNFDETLKRNRVAFPDVSRKAEDYISFGYNILDKLLVKGIIPSDTALLKRDKNFVINILRGNTAEKQTIENIPTQDKARQWLADSLPYARLAEPEFLLPLLDPLLTPNLIFNEVKTKAFKQEELDRIATARGMVKSGELIVPRNAIISQNVYQRLTSYKEQYENNYLSSRKFIAITIGYILLTGLILFLYLFYLRNHLPTVFIKLRWVLFLLSWVILYSFLTYAVKASDILDVYLVPFCIVPLVVKNFYNRELAFITHIIVILIVGLIAAPGYEFLVLQILAGFVATYNHYDMRYSLNFFKMILTITAVYMVGYISFSLIEETQLGLIKWSILVWIGLNALLTFLAFPFVPLLGNLYGFTTSINLMELSDLNHPLLRALSLKAPGTMQHSLQVANIADAAANAIGADALLVRVAALYHDIGKTLKPMYFIENQGGKNPHDDIPYLQSAQIIIEHVTEGVKIAEENNLPKIVIDFIPTHHGTTVVEYFYRLHAQNTEGGGKDDKQHFQYHGPKPRTKEETILMLADSLEATSKILKQPDTRSIDDLVERIVKDKIQQGQLENSALSFDDLEKCKASFKQTLKNINHVRIEYPSVVKNDKI